MMIGKSILLKKIHNTYLLLFAYLSILGYIIISAHYFRIGFPLDDAWIHQTYARNLSRGFGWSFIPGVPSSGSTAPLWTLLISIGHFFELHPITWVFILGGICLYLSSICIRGVINSTGERLSAIWFSLLFLFEWHFVWASVSGMETILGVLLPLFLFVILSEVRLPAMYSGILIGISVWVRPDMLTLLLPAVLIIASRDIPWSKRRREILVLLFYTGLFTIAYLGFNLAISGRFMATTFYAKQAEYASLRVHPFIFRYAREFNLAMIGPGSLLLPGFVYVILQAKRQISSFAFILWYLLYVGIYAWLLPVTYQHGRYMMPAMGIYYLCGALGTIRLAEHLRQTPRVKWFLSTVWLMTFGILSISFWYLGGISYAKDVAFIETQMVETANWVQANTPTNTLLAVHDIGAMGYFSERKFVDLAGLINPEIIPFIRDETKIAEYLTRNNVDLLVCFPSWYPDLTQDLVIIYQAQELQYTSGYGEFLSVYEWSPHKFIR